MKNLTLITISIVALMMSACASSSLTKEVMNDELKQIVEQNRQLREQRVNSLIYNN